MLFAILRQYQFLAFTQESTVLSPPCMAGAISVCNACLPSFMPLYLVLLSHPSFCSVLKKLGIFFLSNVIQRNILAINSILTLLFTSKAMNIIFRLKKIRKHFSVCCYTNVPLDKAFTIYRHLVSIKSVMLVVSLQFRHWK